MPSDGSAQAVDLLCQFDARLIVGRIVADVDHGNHAGQPRFSKRLLRGEWFRQMQEMGVRIDQATGSGFSMRGKSGSPRDVWVRGASLPHCLAWSQGAFRSARTWAAMRPAVSGRNGEIR